MSSPYQLLFRVSFGHAFFADGILRALRIAPTPTCRDMLHKAGVLLRAQDDGLAVYGDEAAAARMRLQVEEAGGVLNMGFLIFVTAPHFFDYTMPTWPKGKMLFLNTAASFPDHAGRQMLHATPFVPASAFLVPDHADLKPILARCILASTPAMVLQVAVTSDLLDATLPRQREFHVRFDTASSHWKYYLFGFDDTQNDIVDLTGEIEFDHVRDVAIEGRSADVFVSKRALPMREAPPARFQLYAGSPSGDKLVIKRMPNASVGKRFRDSKDGNEILVSEIFVNH